MLKNLKDQLKANTASIPTTLGGSNHGYLGLILSPTAYMTITATPFQEPTTQANTPPSLPEPMTQTPAPSFAATPILQQLRKSKNVITVLKNQLLSAINNICVCALNDHHVGYMNQTIYVILNHLFTNYGNVTPLELEDNDTNMRLNWDPKIPFDCLIKQIEDGQDYAEDGGLPYTTKQLLCITYTLVFITGLYFEECKQWNNRPTAETTWATFKTQFHNTQCLLHDQLHTTKQAGFHNTYANHTPTTETQPLLNTMKF